MLQRAHMMLLLMPWWVLMLRCVIAWLSCVDRSSMAYEWFPACCWSMSRRVATRPLWSTCDCTCSEKFDSTIHRLWCGMVWPSPDDKMYQHVIIKVLMTLKNLTQSNIHVRFWRNVKHRLINGPQMRHRLKDGCTSCHLKPSTPFYTWSLCWSLLSHLCSKSIEIALQFFHLCQAQNGMV